MQTNRHSHVRKLKEPEISTKKSKESKKAWKLKMQKIDTLNNRRRILDVNVDNMT